MKESLPPNVLKEKLPRFLQKCTHTFQSDRRYKNDLRYLRVWLQLVNYITHLLFFIGFYDFLVLDLWVFLFFLINLAIVLVYNATVIFVDDFKLGLIGIFV